MSNVQDKVVEKIKTHIMFNNRFPNIVSYVKLCGEI